MVRHSKWHVFAAMAMGLAAVAGGALYAANTQSDIRLYVASVEVSLFAVNGSTGGPSAPPFIFFTAALVQIVDQGGQPVSGATVQGTFTSCDEEYGRSARTNANGVAIVKGQRWSGCFHDFTVTSVTKNGWSWDPPVPVPSALGNCDCN